MLEQDVAPIDTFQDMLRTLGKYTKTSMPAASVFEADGYIRDTFIPMLITAMEYRTTFRLAVGGWPYTNLKTLFLGDNDDVMAINNAIRRQTASAEAQHDQQALFSVTGRPKKPVMLLCSEHDLTVPSFHCESYAKMAKEHQQHMSTNDDGSATDAPMYSAKALENNVGLLLSSQAVHLRFARAELNNAVDRLLAMTASARQVRESPLTDVFTTATYSGASPVSDPYPDKLNSQQHVKWRAELQSRVRKLLDKEI